MCVYIVSKGTNKYIPRNTQYQKKNNNDIVEYIYLSLCVRSRRRGRCDDDDEYSVFLKRG